MPRAGLSADRVVEEAESVADEIGLEKVTLAAVAARLGVKLPSLYKHIDSLAALRQELGERSRQELAEVMARATVGRSGADAVASLAGAYRRWALAHPGRYEATIAGATVLDGGAPSAGGAAATRVIFEVLDAGYGLRGDDAVDATRALRSALHGFIALEAGGGFAMPVDVDRSFERLVAMVIRSLPQFAPQPENEGGSARHA